MANDILLRATITLLLAIFLVANAGNLPVLDAEGEPLEVGSTYYALSGGWGAAGRGGLTYSSKSGSPIDCPQYVAQLSSWFVNGSPITFYPSDPSQKQITEGSDINIGFQFRPNYCRDSGVWMVTNDENTKDSYVSISGEVGPNAVGTWFKLQSIGTNLNIYKILHCSGAPSLKGSQDDEGECQQLDATHFGLPGLRFLGLVPAEQPLPFFGFVFKKASENDINHNYHPSN